MPRVDSMTNFPPGSGRMGEEQRVLTGDLTTDVTLTQGSFVEAFSVQADETLTYAGGHGPQDNETAVSYSDLDLQDSGNNAVDDELRWAVYADSGKTELMAVSSVMKTAPLRSAQSNSARTDKIATPGFREVPPKDGYLVLEVNVNNSTNDGNTLSSSNSADDFGLAYTKIRRR